MKAPAKLREIIRRAPDSSGVYFMKDDSGGVIYVGKAKSLRKRLLSYLSLAAGGKTALLMSHVRSIEWKLTQTESLALLLESSFIRQYIPRYNVALRDDKSFPYIKITHEDYPALCISRKRQDDGAEYFGPFTSVNLLKEALRIIRRHFPYRTCRTLPKNECMYCRINLCPGPCAGKVSRHDYARRIRDIKLILRGGIDELVGELSARMQEYSRQKRYEEAALVRDQINALSAIEKGKVTFGRAEELESLKILADMDKLPEKIEAFDISNTFGNQATGSMVSFYKAEADKNNYRRFRIKTVEKIDDYGMLREVIRRRYSRLLEEKAALPDLLLIDGGKGHLESACGALADLGLSKLPVISIAKEFEHIYVKGKAYPVRLREGSPVLNLIRRIRDEAHRFAITYHRLLRKKHMFKEGL